MTDCVNGTQGAGSRHARRRGAAWSAPRPCGLPALLGFVERGDAIRALHRAIEGQRPEPAKVGRRATDFIDTADHPLSRHNGEVSEVLVNRRTQPRSAHLQSHGRYCGWSCAGCGNGPSCSKTCARSRQSIQAPQAGQRMKCSASFAGGSPIRSPMYVPLGISIMAWSFCRLERHNRLFAGLQVFQGDGAVGISRFQETRSLQCDIFRSQ